MRIKKELTISLNIDDPITDLSNEKLLQIIKRKYESVCYAGCYIQNINSIVRKSNLYVNQEGAPDFATISVTIDIDAIVYFKDEVICGSIVINNEKDNFVCRTPHADIVLDPNSFYAAIAPGQKIMIRVSRSIYKIFAPRPSVKGRVFTFEEGGKIWRVPAGATIDIGFMADLLQEIGALQARLAAFPAKNRETFMFFLYSYKFKFVGGELTDPFNFAGKKNKIDLVDLMKLIKDEKITFPESSTYLHRSPYLNLCLPLCYGYSELTEENQIFFEDMNIEATLLGMFRNYYEYLRILVENLDIYNEQELKRHKILWQILSTTKLEPLID